MYEEEVILLKQRDMSHITSATSDPSSTDSMDSVTNWKIFLEDSKEGHVTWKFQFITNVK